MNFKIAEKSVSYSNVIKDKSFDFAVRIIKLYRHFRKTEAPLDPILKQLLRSGTSIGANVHEAQGAITKKDFINKLQISLKEANESEYWINLLFKTDILNSEQFQSLENDCKELIKLLTSILKSLKSNV
jgi:four helix bundle protein